MVLLVKLLVKERPPVDDVLDVAVDTVPVLGVVPCWVLGEDQVAVGPLALLVVEGIVVVELVVVDLEVDDLVAVEVVTKNSRCAAQRSAQDALKELLVTPWLVAGESS